LEATTKNVPENLVETLRVLVVSREMALLRPLWSIGESNAWHLETAASGWEAMERVQSDVVPHLLLLDLPRGDGDSLHVLRWLRRLRPDMPVVVTCHPEDASREKEATRLGANEVLIRPFNDDRLEFSIRRHLVSANENVEVEIASEDVESVGEDEFFLSASPVMQKLRAQAELLAQADVPVLILGEPGSGKSTVARLIHKLSVNSGFRFLRVDCATMPGELLEIELFGRTNGANHGPNHGSNYSGRNGAGKLELGEKGTLLLNEITEMPMALQSRLLQVLQDKQFFRSGDDRPVEVDLRILASSSVKLDRALAERRLREDLYYRLSAFTVHVPPLRQRKEEIKILLRYAMHKMARRYGLPPREFTMPALDACVNHSWAGNLQELETFVKRYLVAGDKELTLGDAEQYSGNGSSHTGNGSNGKGTNGNGSHPVHTLRPAASSASDAEENNGASGAKSLKSIIQSVKSEAERNAIAAALEKTGWNRKAAARLLKVSYRTLLYKIDQYHMSASEPYLPPFAGARLATSGDEIKGNGKVS
jgi:two-component system, NtrC family, response regulator AtoC